ncbi:MAG: ABC transporter substrate-binding protein [Candidatus Limivivens sp.]|nr:ABC transporter substrate-binding protein [Candidatus Limivivens sp.]
MFKKVLAGLCASALLMTSAVPAFAEEEKEPITMSVFWWGSQLRNERTQQILDMYAEEHPYITFDGQFSDDYWTRMATLAAGHTLPDVVQMVYAYLSQYAEEGTLVDLTPYIEDGTIDVSNVAESVLETGKVGDGIYAICNGINASALFYNKTLLDEAGIEIHDYMTVEEFKDICRQVYEKTGYKTSLSYGGYTSETYLQYLLRAEGKHLYGDGALGVDSAEDLLPFFQLYEDGLAEGWHLDPSLYVERTRGQVQEDPMVYGSSPENMSWCGFYASNQLVAMQAAAPEGVDIALTTFPTDNYSDAAWLNPSQFFCVSADSEHPDEAAALIDYITNSIDCNSVLLGERGVPISSVVADAIAEKQSADDQEVIAYINEVVTPSCSTIDAPSPSSGSEVVALLDALTEKVMYGELSAQEAAEQFFEQANAILAE